MGEGQRAVRRRLGRARGERPRVGWEQRLDLRYVVWGEPTGLREGVRGSLVGDRGSKECVFKVGDIKMWI